VSAPLNLLILSDGRAGHVSTARGMADLIAGSGPTAVTQREIRLRAKGLRPLLKWLVNTRLGERLLARWPMWPGLFYRGYAPTQADVVLSAGGDTIYLNALLGRRARNIFCGSLRGVRATLFDLIVHIRPADLDNWMALEVLPSSARAEAASQAAVEFAQTRLGGHADDLWCLLIGGDGSGYRLDADAAVTTLRACADLAARHGKRLLVSTSRRTGDKTERALADWLAAHPEAPVAYLVLYGAKPERVATAFMALAEWVFCTEDSLSMISESVLLRRPLVTLAPADARPAPDHQALLSRLSENRRLWRVAPSDLVGLDMTRMADSWQAYDRADHAALRARMLSIVARPGDGPARA
jgi:mitochondrial fission protein ELM1